MKRLFLAFLLFFAFFPFFSFGGAFSGEGSLRVIKTEWFDVIYSDKSEESARKIASVADSFYREITERLGTDMYQRFPVSVTPAVESMNAFFTVAPYNSIVVYDTSPSEALDMHEDTIEAVFYHELTHAVTLNMKSPFMRGMSRLSDSFNLAGVSLTSFWFEGAAVSMEGRGTSGGRMNDPFTTQLVTAAKMRAEAKVAGFPSWRDVTGARDTVPGGNDAYVFGAAFATYLQETYGMELYGKFWENAGTSCTLSFCAGVFETTYGIGLSEAWRGFYEWIPVPESFAGGGGCLPRDKKRNRRYVRTMDVFAGGKSPSIAFYDSQSQAVFIVDAASSKARRLLSLSDVQSIRFSPDGKKLAVTRLVSRSNVKSESGVIDIAGRSYKTISKSDSFFASFAPDGSFVASGASSLKNGAVSLCPPVPAGEGRSARVVKDGLSWSIVVDGDGESRSFDMGGRIIHNLHYCGSFGGTDYLSFSWAELGRGFSTLSRAGIVSLSGGGGRVLLQKADWKAGILDCALISLGGGKMSFSCVVENFESHPLVTAEMDESGFEEFAFADDGGDDEHTVAAGDAGEGEARLDAGKYSPLPFYLKGSVFPFGTAEIYSREMDVVDTGVLGATFVSSNPWLGNMVSVSAGFSLVYGVGAFSASWSGGNDAVSMKLGGTCAVDSGGFYQATAAGGVSAVLCRFDCSSVVSGIDARFFRGTDDSDDSGSVEGTRAESKAYLSFSSIRRVRPGFRMYGGIAFQPFLLFEHSESVPEKAGDVSRFFNAGATVGARIPLFFPVTMSATLFPSSSRLASWSASLTLLSLEIQKGIPALSVFVHRFVVDASYAGKVAYEHGDSFDVARVREIAEGCSLSDVKDEVSVSASFSVSPNTGYFATSGSFSLGGAFVYRPHPGNGGRRIAGRVFASANF